MQLLGFFRRRAANRDVAQAFRDANDARDARRWAEAATHYRRFLAHRPDDAGIWVQLGHALKESGELREAEAAYRRATELAPRDHDAPLQLGHALKLQGRMAEARAAYARSDELAPINHAAEELAGLAGEAIPPRRANSPVAIANQREREHAARIAEAEAELAQAPRDPALHHALAAVLLQAGRREAAIAAAQAAFAIAPDRRNWQVVRRFGGTPPTTAAPGGAALYDVTDLLNMLRQTGRATGIQRVQLGLAQGILADPQAAAEARFVFIAERHGPLWTLDAEDVAAILHYCLAEPHDAARAEALVEGAMQRARQAHLPSARLFFIMGAFWFWAGAPAALARLRAAGLRIGVLVYDLIPVTHPEHASEGTIAAFRQGLVEGAGLWDFALTISEFTAGELRRQLAALDAPAIPIRPMPLAHRINPPESPPPEAFPAAALDLRGRDYILCVGTIEARKNHLALFQAWQVMLQDGFEPPPLVLVGRPGWRVDDLMAQLKATHFLDGRIRLLHGISDPEMEGLYRHCLFSIFPSFTEGWGLPVGESLALGKLCLAAMEGATPEAAGGFAEPIDAFSPRAIAARVRHFVEDRAALAAAEARLQGFTPRGWPEVTRHFLAELADCMAQAPPRRPLPALPPLADGASRSFAATAEGWPASSLALGAGFESPEAVGSWLLGPSGTLALEAAAPLTLWLRLAAVPWAEGNRAGAAVDDGPLRWISLAPAQEAMLAVEVPAGPFTLRLVVDGPTDPPEGGEHRPIRVALREITAQRPGAPPLAEARAVTFGAADAAVLAMLAEGWDLAADASGVAALAPLAVLRFRVPARDAALRVLLHLDIRPGAAGRLLHAEGGTALPDEGGALLLPLALASGPEGEVEIALRMEDGATPPLRLSALQWAEEGDVAARLAMLEALVLPEAGLGLPATAERLQAIEARLRAERATPAQPLPGGDAGLAALRLAAARKG